LRQFPSASQENLKSYAKKVALDVNAFERCLGSGKFRAIVQRDLIDGVQLGVTGTPTFFINGQQISGNQPLEAFGAILDEELGQTK
jgi:protein-disulfide isomerase